MTANRKASNWANFRFWPRLCGNVKNGPQSWLQNSKINNVNQYPMGVLSLADCRVFAYNDVGFLQGDLSCPAERRCEKRLKNGSPERVTRNFCLANSSILAVKTKYFVPCENW